MITLLEDLPNELILDLFEYISLRDLYYAFSTLNKRFHYIVGSINNLSIIIYKNEQFLFHIFAYKIVHLVVNNVYDIIELRQFPNLRSLTIHRVTDHQLQQIRYELMPHLIYLMMTLSCITPSSTELTSNIFSNQFPSLRHVDLGQISIPLISTWLVSPSLYSVCISCPEPIVIHLILLSCPNLKRLEVKLDKRNRMITLPTVPLNHYLKHLILIDCYYLLTLEEIETICLYLPNLKQLDFQGISHEPFLRLASILSNRLKYLIRFNCMILESPCHFEDHHLQTIRQIHPCFNRIQYTMQWNSYRLFTTDRS